MMNKTHLIYVNIIIFTLCFCLCVVIQQCFHQQYESLFLKSLSYHETYEFQSEDYLNYMMLEDNTKQGQDGVEKTSYQESYHNMLSKQLHQVNILVIFSFVLLYIIVTLMMIVIYVRMNKMTYQVKESIEKIENHEELSQSTYLYELFNKHNQYVEYHMNKVKQEKEFMYQFLMYVTHQLKTPLATLQLMINHQEYTQCYCMSDLENQVQKMNHMISSLLNQGKLDAGRLEIKIKKNDIEVLMNDVYEDIEELARHKNIEIDMNDCEGIAYFDIYWLKEALCNILKNSIEHSLHNQSIHIQITLNDMFIIKMIDHAGGIQDINHIFDRYHTHSYKGVGLGLYLSDMIVRKHFGHISATNTDDGTSFIITIPKEWMM